MKTESHDTVLATDDAPSGVEQVSVKPANIRLEVSTYCQLRCPTCPTTTGETHRGIGAGFLKFADFAKLLDASPWLEEIELSNYGEIFLNPELPQMIEHAHARGVRLTARNGVNLNNATDEMLEALVKFEFQHLRVSLDGASDESYSQYRIRGHFDRVIDNLKKLKAYKKQYDSTLPLLTWQFVVFGHNEHEISKAREMAAELGMEFHLKLNWDDSFSPVQDVEAVRREMESGVASRAEYQEKYGSQYTQYICHQLWDWPQINWNGDVLGCCRNNWGHFGGNVFRDGLEESLNNEQMRYARDMLLGLEEPRDDIPCTTCRLYKNMRAADQVLERESD